jgi:hypothetical protein
MKNKTVAVTTEFLVNVARQNKEVAILQQN